MKTLRNIIKKISQGLSLVFFPMFVPSYALGCLLFLTSYAYYPLNIRLVLLAETFFITCVVPLTYTWLLIRQGVVKDIYIENKEQRIIPYIISIACGALWVYLLLRSGLQACIWLAAAGSVFALVVIAIVTRFWKISAHLTMLGCVMGAFLSFFLQNGICDWTTIGIILTIALLLMWARIFLKAHSSLQTVIGFIVGILCSFLPTVIYAHLNS